MTRPHKKTHPRIGLVSLGCAKALVDSERIVTQLRAEGYEIAPDYDAADLVIVNTCGFLDSARAESLDAIGEAMAENGKVIVTGCLGVAEPLIRQKFPDVLAVTGPHSYEKVVAAVHQALPPKHDPKLDLIPAGGLKLTPRHYAYLKISEGCNHACSFCIIPQIRGPLVSRPVGEVLREAEALAGAGVKELLVISQDTSAYGVDLKYRADEWRGSEVRTRMTELADALGELGIWVRLHYVYPYPHVDELLPLMAEGRVLPYLDVPFQHASPSILAAMKRPGAQDQILERLARWRAQVPDLAVRSTFIVGFPGESDADFEQLLSFLREARLARVGCFTYENVEGAPARELPGHLPERVKKERWEAFMAVQQEVSAAVLQARVGREVDVLVDAVDAKGAIARSAWDAPEVDGNVFVDDARHLQPGDMARVKLTYANEYDMWAKLV
jgi:ribosomal protein S12 methylthiotransferase